MAKLTLNSFRLMIGRSIRAKTRLYTSFLTTIDFGICYGDLERTTFSISHFDYFFTPDFSLWRDLPTEYYNQQNTFRTRFVGLFWQLRGFKTIPTYSFGGLQSFSYCLEGLPSHSIIAVSGLSNRKDAQAYNVWCYGLRRLEEEKFPTLILVYGPEIDIPDLHTPVIFMKDFISKRFRHG